MHIRLLTWLSLCVCLAVVPLHVQAQVQAQATFAKEGQVMIAKVVGTVNMTANGVTNQVKVQDLVPKGAKIVTALNSSVVIVYSNGATTQLGPDTDFVMDEFMQEDFPSTIRVADLAEEPSPSRTRLTLNKGEIVGNVKKLKHGAGSTYTVQTPVGAAGIRGTTFRIVFRPTGTGQAFGAQGAGQAQPFQFQLSTLEGDVGFQQGAAGGPGNAGGVAPGTATVGGVSVPTGQEIVVTGTATQNAQGQVVVVSQPTVTSTLTIPPAAAAAFAATAQEIISSSSNATFTPGGQGIVGNINPPQSVTNPQNAPVVSPPAAPQGPRLTTGDGVGQND